MTAQKHTSPIRLFLYKNDGYLSTESAFIFPLIITITLVSMILSVLYIQNLIFSLRADRISTQIITTIDNPYRNINTGRIAYEHLAAQPLYSNFSLSSTHVAPETELYQIIIQSNPIDRSLLHAQTQNTNHHVANKHIRLSNNLFLQKLTIQYNNPFRILRSNTHNASTFDNQSHSFLICPPRTIRNTDFIMNLVTNPHIENHIRSIRDLYS